MADTHFEEEEEEEYDEESPDLIQNLLPDKSKQVYEARYKKFVTWKKENNFQITTENIILAYLRELSEKFAPSTVFCNYTGIKRCCMVKEFINCTHYKKIDAFLKKILTGYESLSRQTHVFKLTEIERFFATAPDEKWLDAKIIAIMGICGAPRRSELIVLTEKDVVDYGTHFQVNIPETNSTKARSFPCKIPAYMELIRKYQALRPKNCQIPRFFLRLLDGKCVQQPMGINTISKIPKKIAGFLQLMNAHEYTGHSFHRTLLTRGEDDNNRRTLVVKHSEISGISGRHNHGEENARPAVKKIIVARTNDNKNYVTLPDGTPVFSKGRSIHDYLKKNSNNFDASSNNNSSRKISKSLEIFLKQLSNDKDKKKIETGSDQAGPPVDQETTLKVDGDSNLNTEKINDNKNKSFTMVQTLQKINLKTNGRTINLPVKRRNENVGSKKVKILRNVTADNLEAKKLTENEDKTEKQIIKNLPLKSEIIVEEILSDVEDSSNVNNDEKSKSLTEQKNITETFDKNPSLPGEISKYFADEFNFDDDKNPKQNLTDENPISSSAGVSGDKCLSDQEEYSKLNIDELAELLGTIIKHPDTIKILKDELIDGSMFLELTDNDLKEINIKLGPRKLIIREINKAKENKSDLIKPRKAVKKIPDIPNEIVEVKPLVTTKILSENRGNLVKAKVDNIADVTPPVPTKILFQNIKCEPVVEEILPDTTNVDDDPLSTEKFSASNNLQAPFKFSRFKTVKETLLNYPNGRGLVEGKSSEILFTQKEKLIFVQIVVAELAEVYKTDEVLNRYPPLEAKISLAEAIIKEFPALKDESAGPNGYEHFYNPINQRGSIENRLVKIRSKYCFSSKKNNVTKDNGPQNFITANSNENEFHPIADEKLIDNCELNLEESNKEVVQLYRTWLKDTFVERRKWIKQNPRSVLEISKKYPQLFYYNGEMINIEFEMLYPGRGNCLIKKFPLFTKKILSMSENDRYRFRNGRATCYKCIAQDQSNFTDDNFRALMILAKTLYNSGPDNSEENDKTLNPLVKIVPNGCSIVQYVESISHEQDEHSASIILMNEQLFYPAYIYGGGNLLALKSDNLEPIQIIDLFYKYTHVMGLKCPKGLENFFNILDCHFYRLLIAKSSPDITSLYIQIYNHVIPNDIEENKSPS